MLNFLDKSSCHPKRSHYLCCLFTHIPPYGTHSDGSFSALFCSSHSWHKQLVTSTHQVLTQMADVNPVTDINRNCKNKSYTRIIQNLSFVLLLKNKLERELVFRRAVAMDPDVSTTAAQWKHGALGIPDSCFPPWVLLSSQNLDLLTRFM